MWKTTKNITRPSAHNAPIKQTVGCWTKDGIQKAQILAKHLESTFQLNDQIVLYANEAWLISRNDIKYRAVLVAIYKEKERRAQPEI